MPGVNRLNIDVLGTSFTVRADEDETYLKRILWYFKHKVEETKRRIHTADPMKISILTSFYIIDELLREKNWGGKNSALPEESEEMERIALRLTRLRTGRGIPPRANLVQFVDSFVHFGNQPEYCGSTRG